MCALWGISAMYRGDGCCVIACIAGNCWGFVLSVRSEASVSGASSNIPWVIESIVGDYGVSPSALWEDYIGALSAQFLYILIGVFKVYRVDSSLSWRTIGA